MFIFQLFFVIFLLHVLDDFVLQPVILSKLKQKSFWKDESELYKYDYIAALTIHGLSWSIMINLPIIVLSVMGYSNIIIEVLPSVILIQAVIHALVDDLKANRKKISLVTDQSIHLVQIIIECLFMIV